MIGITFDWFNFFVSQLCGGPGIALLVTLFLYLFILLIGRVSYQMIIQIIGVASIYFATLLFPTKLTLSLTLALAIIYAAYQAYRYVGREQ